MRLSVKAMALASGLIWGGAILGVGLVNLCWPGYGEEFLRIISSVYPWFHASRSFGDVVIGTLDGLVDGLVAGVIFAWLYNLFACKSAPAQV